MRHVRRKQRLSLRNRHGENVELPSFSATVAKNEFGRMLNVALQQGAVAITKHDEPLAVVLAVDEYRSLTGAKEKTIDLLTAEFDELVERMQGAKARAAAEAAFGASPSELGKAAVKAAAKRRG